MTVITVFYPVKEDNKIKVENELYWYDTILKKMNVFKGGYLKYEYIEDEELKNLGYKNCYRMKPKVVDIEKSSNKKIKDKEKLKKFFNNVNYNNISIISEHSEGIDFNVPENEVESFTDELYRERFFYEEN